MAPSRRNGIAPSVREGTWEVMVWPRLRPGNGTLVIYRFLFHIGQQALADLTCATLLLGFDCRETHIPVNT